MKTVNCIGDFCPIPILKIQKMLESIEIGESFMAITDHDCVLDSIDDFLNTKGITYTSSETESGVWEIIITKVK